MVHGRMALGDIQSQFLEPVHMLSHVAKRGSCRWNQVCLSADLKLGRHTCVIHVSPM